MLTTNYRSTDEIIAFSGRVISGNKTRYAKDITGTGKSGPKPRIMVSDDQNHEAVQIAARVRDAIRKGTPPTEIAVAFRLNMQARALADAFLNMNIPFKTRDEMPTLYDHWIAEDFFAYLRGDALAVANRPFRFIPKAFLEDVKKNNRDFFACYMRHPMLHTAVKTRIEELQGQLARVKKLSPVAALRFIRLQIGYNGHIIDMCERRGLRPVGLMEIADELVDAAKQFDNADRFIAHARSVAAFSKENRDLAAPAVTLTTLHSAKGLEFSRVFIAGAVEDVLPSQHSRSPQEIEEERRLFYVGATRAKHMLHISTMKTRYDKPTKPTRFLAT
jgi:DNA helicase-2/ATP-dependent DNA helicase PcrA